MFKGLYNRVMRLSGSRHAGWALAAIGFAEASFFPIPPDVLLAPMILAKPHNAWRYAALTAACSVIGGMLGYLIGHSLHDLAHEILDATGSGGAEAWIEAHAARQGVLLVLALGLVPIPFKLVTITAGLIPIPFWQLVAASIVTRSARFFGVTWLVKRFGPGLLPIIERRLMLVGGVVLTLAVAAILGLRLIHR